MIEGELNLKPEDEVVAKAHADRTYEDGKRVIIIIGVLILLSLLASSMFAFSTIVRGRHETSIARQAEVRSTTALQTALHTEHTTQQQINGEKAMIFAVCKAFHRRDAVNNLRWAKVTEIELRTRKSSFDPIYHAERRIVLSKSEQSDKAGAKFSCAESMQKAYLEAYSEGPTQKPVAQY